MSRVVLGKRNGSGVAPNPGPYLKGVDGTNLLTVDGVELQAVELLGTTYLLEVDSGYLFDAQADAPTPALSMEVGYPIQAASVNYVAPPPGPLLEGGEVTTSGGYIYHSFVSSDTLSLSYSNLDVEYVVVAAGGGGNYAQGGGGGGGEAISGSITLTPGSRAVTVGAGGLGYVDGVQLETTSGEDSSIEGITTALGGGAAGMGASGFDGGSGGGGSGRGNKAGGLGNLGGDGGNSDPRGSYPGGGGGGGGGAGGDGQDANSSNDAGDGGPGIEWPTGSGNYYGGGGGAGTRVDAGLGGTPGSGGVGGGGDGGPASGDHNGSPGTPNTGGGGGGGTFDNPPTVLGAGGDGGSGIVIVRYPE